MCVAVQLSAAAAAGRVEAWRPGAARLESVRHQARYDQSRTEEHPAAGESDDDDEEQNSEQNRFDHYQSAAHWHCSAKYKYKLFHKFTYNQKIQILHHLD